MLGLHFQSDRPRHPGAVKVNAGWQKLLHLDLLQRGLYSARRGLCALMLPMTEEDVDEAAAAYEEVFREYRVLAGGSSLFDRSNPAEGPILPSPAVSGWLRWKAGCMLRQACVPPCERPKPMTSDASPIPYLSEELLAGLGLTTTDMIDSIEALIRGAAAGRVWSAAKAVVQPGDGRYMMAALAAMDGPSFLAAKTVVLNPTNPDWGLPQINGLVTMLDSQTGLPAAILDGNWITAVRTAALSATAAKRLAKPDATLVGFVGCGVQARSHLSAFCELFPLRAIKLFGRGQANIDKLSDLATDLKLSVEVCDSGQAAIEGVDLIVTSTTATGGMDPFLDASGLAKGAFAAITDLGVPWHRESFAALDRVVIDDLKQEAEMPNKLCDPAFVAGDISGLVQETIPGRVSAEERTVFLFRGHALGDLALSVLVLTRHREKRE